MGHQQKWSIKVLIVVFIFAVVPVLVKAQPEDDQLPALFSTGLPAVELPEDILPQNAIVYLRANNVQVLLENIDSLLQTFVPEKALPPELQSIFANPQPFIAFIGMQAFGKPLSISSISDLIGIALDRPMSMAFYPMEPDKGFVLSLPIANPTSLTATVQNILMPETVEKGTIGDVSYYHVVGGNYDLPRDVYLLTSDRAAFFCGSLEVAQMLVNSENIGKITADPVITKGIKKYENRDVTLVASHAFIKPQIPMFKASVEQVLVSVFEEMRAKIEELPAEERILIDARLRLEVGIESIEQLVDYAEAYATGIYKVLLNEVVQLLINLEGFVLSVNLEEKFQNVALTLFSQDIKPETLPQPLSVDEIKQALNALPGNKSNLLAVGQMPVATSPKLFTKILNAVEEELRTRDLPMDGFLAVKDYYLAKQCPAALESKVAWTLGTLVSTTEKMDFSQFSTLWEFFKAVLERLSGGPFVLSAKLMPTVAEGLIAQHYAEQAELITRNEEAYREMRAKLPFRKPFYDLTGRFQQEDVGDGVKKLTFEKVYTTHRGFFGYQQHELINRRMLYHQKLPQYEFLYDAIAEAPVIMELFSEKTQPVPAAVLKLLEQTPAGANTVSVLRALYLVSDLLDILTEVEDLIRRELNTFLMEAQELIYTYEAEEIGAKLLESGLEPPLLLGTLNLDADGKIYATLPGGLHYPRPKVLPKVQELFKDFLAVTSEVGGAASFVAVQPGEFEISSIQNTEALALLVKTVVNNFYEQYMASPEGMQLLQEALAHPKDFQVAEEEVIFTNPLWQFILEGTGGPMLGGLEESKRSRTMADMRAIGVAVESFMIDNNFYPQQETAVDVEYSGLPQEYYSGAYTDAWGMPYIYISDAEGSQYLIMSYGRDQMPGMMENEFDADIVFMNGQFVAPWEIAGDMTSTLNSVLLQAVEKNSPDFVRTMVSIGADPNFKTENDEPILVRTAVDGNVEMVRTLLEYGADVEAKDSYNLTALFSAAYEGHTEVVQTLLDYGADMTVRNDYGMTALLWAAWNGHTETLQTLLDYGAFVNETDNDKETPLMKAAFQGHLEVVQTLLNYGADVNILDAKGETALMNAASEGHTEVVQLLIDNGADLNVVDDEAVTALLSAAYGGHTEVAQILVENGAEVNVANQYGMTPLLWAAWNGYPEIVAFLLEHGADINAKDNDGTDALMNAAYQGYTDIVTLLIEKGADVNTTDNYDQSAMLFAQAYGDTEFVEMLKNAGAKEVSADRVEQYRQTATVATMRSIGNALTNYQADNGSFPTTTVDDTNIKEIELSEDYYSGTFEDMWGTAFKYTSDGSSYTIKSYGRDKASGGTGFDADIVFKDGEVVAPEELK